MNLILFGFKGCGKTHFGKLIASMMKRKFIDTDELIIKLHYSKKKKSIHKIHREIGEEEFRKLEQKALKTLVSFKDCIIALGGGSVLNPENVKLLQRIGALIYLKSSAETLKRRIFKGELPSFLDQKNPESSFDRMIQEREPIYRSIPSRIIDTDELDEAGVLASLNSILLLEEPPNGF